MNDKLRQLELELEQADSKEARLDALIGLARELTDLDFIETWKLATQALELANELNIREAKAAANETLGNSLWKLGEYTSAMDSLEAALDLYLGMGDLYRAARCYCGLGIICGITEQYRSAIEYFEEGISASRRSNHPDLAATIIGNIGHIYFNMGRYNDAMEYFRNGHEYYKDKGNDHAAGNMISGMAGIHVYLGEYDKGLELTRRALNMHKQAKHQRGIAVTMMNVGIALYRMGKLELAKTELKSALNYARSINLKLTEHDILKHLSKVCSELGQESESKEYANLYIDGQKEEHKLSVKRKAEQYRQRQLLREAMQQ